MKTGVGRHLPPPARGCRNDALGAIVDEAKTFVMPNHIAEAMKGISRLSKLRLPFQSARHLTLSPAVTPIGDFGIL